VQLRLSISLPYINHISLLTKLGKKTEWSFYLFNHTVQLCKLCSTEWNMKTCWVDNIQKVAIAFWSYCYVLFAWNNWWSPLQIKLSTILAVKLIFFYFQISSTERYQYTRKAAVIKLSFWFRWLVMLLMCDSFICRLQELKIFDCSGMTDRGLLEGIGSLHKLTSLLLHCGFNLTAQALSTFLHRRSVSSIVLLHLSACKNLDDEGLKGIAERCNKLTYLHV